MKPLKKATTTRVQIHLHVSMATLEHLEDCGWTLCISICCSCIGLVIHTTIRRKKRNKWGKEEEWPTAEPDSSWEGVCVTRSILFSSFRFRASKGSGGTSAKALWSKLNLLFWFWIVDSFRSALGEIFPHSHVLLVLTGVVFWFFFFFGSTRILKGVPEVGS